VWELGVKLLLKGVRAYLSTGYNKRIPTSQQVINVHMK